MFPLCSPSRTFISKEDAAAPVQLLSHVQLLVTSRTVACQASMLMAFPRQEYWSTLLFSSPENLPDAGIEPASPALVVRFFTTEPLGKPMEGAKCC